MPCHHFCGPGAAFKTVRRSRGRSFCWDNQVMVFLRISRETPRHNVSRGGQIIPSSLEVAKSYHLYLIKITQPLTSLEEPRIIPSLLLSRDQNQTIPTSLEGHNHTIHTSLELPQSDHTPLELLNQTIHPPSYKKFWHTCIITPDPLCAKVPKLICISHVVNRVEG